MRSARRRSAVLCREAARRARADDVHRGARHDPRLQRNHPLDTGRRKAARSSPRGHPQRPLRRMTRLPALAVGCALLSSLSWGFGISAVKHALGYLPPAHLLLVQLVFSALVIALLAAVQGAPRPSLRQALLGGATGILEFGLGYGVGTIGLYLTTA